MYVCMYVYMYVCMWVLHTHMPVPRLTTWDIIVMIIKMGKTAAQHLRCDYPTIWLRPATWMSFLHNRTVVTPTQLDDEAWYWLRHALHSA